MAGAVGASDGAVREFINDFYQRNNILFWQNFVDGSALRTISGFIDIHSRHGFQIYTPILTLIVLIVTAGWLLGLSWGRNSIWRVCRKGSFGSRRIILQFERGRMYANGSVDLGVRVLSPVERHQLAIVNAALRFALLFVPITFVLLSVFQDESFSGLAPTPTPIGHQVIGVMVAMVAGTASSMLLLKAKTGSELAASRMPLVRLCAVAVLLLSFGTLIGQQPRLYDQTYRTIWFDPIVAILPLWVERVALLLALGFAIWMCLFGTERVLGRTWTSRLSGLGSYL